MASLPQGSSISPAFWHGYVESILYSIYHYRLGDRKFHINARMITTDDILDTAIGLNVADTDQVITSTANVPEDLIRGYPVDDSQDEIRPRRIESQNIVSGSRRRQSISSY